MGQNIAFVAEGTGVGVDLGYGETASITNIGSASQTKFLLNWSTNRANIQVSGLAQATAGTSGQYGPDANTMLWYRNTINAALQLTSSMNQQAYIGDGLNQDFCGLLQAIGSTSNTYGGIARSSNTLFQPYVANPGTPTALSFAQIRGDLAQIYINSGRRPDIAMCHPNVLSALASLYDPQKFYMFGLNPMSRVIETQRGDFTLQGGIGAIDFDGCKFVEDKDCPDGYIFYINRDHVWIEVLPMNMSVLDGDESYDAALVREIYSQDEFGPLPFGFQVDILAKNTDSDTAMVKWYSNLCVNRPNSCGVRYNINA
jgi:hypothetical protein